MAADPSRALLLREFLDALDEVESAGEALQEHWSVYRLSIQGARRHLAAGGSVPELLAARGPTVVRSTMKPVERSAKGPVHRLEVARVRAQQAMYRLAAADGMNATEIARAWAVSRQLVSRLLNDSEAHR